MRSDHLTIQPQTVQFGRDNTQTIKIINNTSQSIPNFFFCLYNTEKFTFAPDSFSLAPHQHKLITVTLRVKSGRSSAKQFAYLKAADINRRITLVLNQFLSPQVKSRTGEQGYEDMNTLSSRDYKDVQNQAIEKIIREKEAYIAMLEKERDSVNRNINFRTEESGEKANHYRYELDELSVKYTLLENEKNTIERENTIIHSKFEEYKKLCQNDLNNYEKVNQDLREKIDENTKLQEEINFLEVQGEQFLSKIEEKQGKIRELEQANRRVLEDSRRQAEKKFNHLEERLQEQRKKYQQSSACAEQRIKDLEKQLSESQVHREKVQYYEKEMKKREDEIKSLMAAVETERSNVKQLEAEKKKMIKLEVSYENLTEKNSDLTSRLKEMEKVNQNLKEELFVYKSKVADNDASSDKMNQYMQIALESCRNENEALKRTKVQLQKSLDEIMNVNRQSHDNNRTMSDQVAKYKEEIKLLNEIKDSLERRNEEIKQENHLAMMQLKTQNIELLEKLSAGGSSKREDVIKQLQDQNHLLKKDLAVTNVTVSQLTAKNQQLVVDNTKLTEKVKKYKKEAKKELKSINDTAINQLNKEHEEKKQMAKRISQLQEVILNFSCEKVKESKDQQSKNERSSSRVTGIKDQRKQIIYSQGSNTEVYGELGELRELNKFIREEEDRFNKMYDLLPEDEADRDESRTIFRVIRFFKRLENKLSQERQQQNMNLLKETEYLKGRIKQLEVIKEDKENMSSINLSKTREHCSELLEFVRQEMKSQYKKLNETLKLSQQKYDLLKKKIYDQYRARIIDTLNKKDKHTIAQLETILERFIDGMSNLSHKEAVLHKQIKLKQNARRQNSELKEKVNQLNFLLQSKKGHCTRDPVKLLYNQTELEWQESLKRQAELLTLTAQYQRLKEEFELVQAELADSKQQIRGLEKELEEKSSEIFKLKKYQIQIQNNYQSEIQRQYDIIEENKKKVVEMTKTTKDTFKHYSKEKQYNQIKDSYDRQKEVIKQLRDKEKLLEQLLEETHRSEEKERKKVSEETRIMQSMRDLKESNRELRAENAKLKEKVNKLEDEMEKKNLYMKNLKGDIEENRIRAQRKDEAENELLKDENKKLAKDLEKVKDQLEKLKKKKEKEHSELKNEIERLRNENLITEKSLESIIRALIDTDKKVYSRLRRVVKKKGKEVEDQSQVFERFKGVQVNALKIDEAFEEVLDLVETQE